MGIQKQFELLEVRVIGGSSYREYTVYIKEVLTMKRLRNLIKNSMKLTGMKSKVANIHLNLMKYL